MKCNISASITTSSLGIQRDHIWFTAWFITALLFVLFGSYLRLTNIVTKTVWADEVLEVARAVNSFDSPLIITSASDPLNLLDLIAVSQNVERKALFQLRGWLVKIGSRIGGE